MAQVSGMKEKLADFKRFRAVYQNMRSLWKIDQQYRGVEKSWISKLESCIREAIEDTTSDSIDIRKYLEKVLESKPATIK
jgi:hypothetical protein